MIINLVVYVIMAVGLYLFFRGIGFWLFRVKKRKYVCEYFVIGRNPVILYLKATSKEEIVQVFGLTKRCNNVFETPRGYAVIITEYNNVRHT